MMYLLENTCTKLMEMLPAGGELLVGTDGGTLTSLRLPSAGAPAAAAAAPASVGAAADVSAHAAGAAAAAANPAAMGVCGNAAKIPQPSNQARPVAAAHAPAAARLSVDAATAGGLTGGAGSTGDEADGSAKGGAVADGVHTGSAAPAQAQLPGGVSANMVRLWPNCPSTPSTACICRALQKRVLLMVL